MRTKNTLLLLTIVSLTTYSCVEYSLTMYHKDYKPTLNSRLRYDGYYTNKKKPWHKIWVNNPFTPKHFDFYRDGFVAYRATHKYDQHLKGTKHNEGHPEWGVYNSSRDTLTMEVAQVKMNSGFMSLVGFINKFTIKQDTLIVFYWASRKLKTTSVDTLYFHAFAFKPDSSKSWLRKIRKYNK